MTLACIATAGLGHWQTGRAHQKEALQTVLADARNAPVTWLDARSAARFDTAASPATGTATGTAVGTASGTASDTVPGTGAGAASGTATGTGADVPAALPARLGVVGRFDTAHSVFLDNRTSNGIAGFHVITPLCVAPAGPCAPVLRGWIAADPRERGRAPSLKASPDVVAVVGHPVAELNQPMLLGSDPEPAAGQAVWQHYSTARFARWSGLSVLPLVLRAESEWPLGSADAPRPAEPPAGQVGAGLQAVSEAGGQAGFGPERHRAYAFQWYTISALLGGGALLLVLHRLRRSRMRPVPTSQES